MSRGRTLAAIGACVILAGAAFAGTAEDATEARVTALLARLSVTDKLRLIAGNALMSVPAEPAIGLPALQMSDGPMGTRIPNPSTAYPGGIGLAATWDPDLAHEIGVQLGRDARSRGAHFLLGPGVNIYRTPLNGRNFEYFGEDPFLAARIAVGYIEGVQSQQVSATIKHFVANNAEYARHTTDSRIDERTLREIYLPVFEAAVREAHVGAVMTAYNLTNGVHMSENAYLDHEVLKREWGFDGLLMSDWGSTYHSIAAANAGLDLEMPSGEIFNARALVPALDSGQIDAGVIDDKVRRLLRLALRFDWLDRAQLDLGVPRYNEAGRAVSLRGAEEAMVLLRNEHQLLPLDRHQVHTLALVGPDAYPALPTAGGSGMVETYGAVSPLTALSDYLGTDGKVLYDRGVRTMAQVAHSTPFTTTPDGSARGVTVEAFANDQLAGAPTAVRVLRTLSIRPPAGYPDADEEDQPADPTDPGAVLSSATSASSMRITGYFTPRTAGRYVVALHTSNRFRLLIDDRVILDDAVILQGTRRHASLNLAAGVHKVVIEHFHPAVRQAPDDFLECGIVNEDELVNPAAIAMAARADVAIVAVGFDQVTEGEGFDREFPLAPEQQALIEKVAAANSRTIVVVTSGGSVDVQAWLPRVSALIEGWYGGEEGGSALARLLFGEANFSGRLPVSWERRLEDNPSYSHYYFDDPVTQLIRYDEGVFTGYRGYEHNGVAPQFPFGFGLSYTSFAYRDLEVHPLAPVAGTGEAGFEVTFTVTNTGTRAGAEVAQLYVGPAAMRAGPARPARELKGFARLELAPGETRRALVRLDARAFSYYDVKARAWRASPGAYRILVGRSSADIVLSGEARLQRGVTIPVGLSPSGTGR